MVDICSCLALYDVICIADSELESWKTATRNPAEVRGMKKSLNQDLQDERINRI